MERLTPAVTRGYGFLEGFLARQRISLANKLIPAVSRQGRILDIGCSEYPLFLMNTAFSERCGLDKIAAAKTIDCAGGFPIRLLSHDVEHNQRIPFEDGYFDVVTMLAVVEHIEPDRMPALMREVRRVLRPGGVYILTTPAAWTDRLLRCMASVRLVSPVEIREHKAAYTPRRICGFLQEAGFSQDLMKTGYFEILFNIWATARKENG